MSHMQMKDKTNVRLSVHGCVMETWHVQCGKKSKHSRPMWQQEHCNHYVGSSAVEALYPISWELGVRCKREDVK